MTVDAGRDRRTADQYTADLERETDASLRRDPTRWPWRTLGQLHWQRAGWRNPDPDDDHGGDR